MQKDMHRYDNLIHNKRPVTKKPMDAEKRAAQFAPFAALTGFDDRIDETARLTDAEKFLDENEKDKIDLYLQYIQEHLSERLMVEITYYVADKVLHKDSDKTGGQYLTKKGIVKKIDTYEMCVVFEDGERISIEAITGIDCGDIF